MKAATSTTTALDSPSSRAWESLGATTRTWPVGDGDLTATVVEIGQGSPIVFLHGLVGLNEHWESVVERVSAHHRCILFQLPLLQLRKDDCSIHGATRLTAEFLQQHMDEPAVLVGNSFGGHVAVRMALEYPRAVRALVLAGASGLIEKSLVSDVQIRPSRAWLVRKIGELFHDKSFMREADIDRAYKELSDRGGARAMVKLSRSARKDHLGDQLGRISQPTLLIWGRQDIVTPPEAAEDFQRGIPGSKLVWFDNCGHAPMIEAAEEFSRAMLEFARDLPRPVRATPVPALNGQAR